MKETVDLQIPQNAEVERALLGALMLDQGLFTVIAETVDSNSFYLQGHRHIFDALVGMRAEGAPVDPRTLAERLRCQGQLEASGGIAYVSELLSTSMRTTSAGEYGRILRDLAVRRDLMRRAERLALEAADPEMVIEEVIDSGSRFLKASAGSLQKQDYFDINSFLEGLTPDLLTSRDFSGLPTGFPDLDMVLMGLEPGEQTILAARPGVGKTSLACRIMENMARAGKHTLFCSLEMGREALGARMLCSVAKVDFQHYRRRSLKRDELEKIERAKKELREMAPYIHIQDTSGITPFQVSTKSEALKEQDELDLVIVDYIQIMRAHCKTGSRNEEVDTISRYLRDSAKELKVHTLNLSQLSRAPEARVDKRPQLSDLRDSGGIEQNADNVLFIYREEMYKPSEENRGQAEIIIGKQRNGPTDTVTLSFLKEFTRFESFAYGEQF